MSAVGYIYAPLIEFSDHYFYESHLNCSWIVKAESGHLLFTIYITDIEASVNCSKDYLKVLVSQLFGPTFGRVTI